MKDLIIQSINAHEVFFCLRHSERINEHYSSMVNTIRHLIFTSDNYYMSVLNLLLEFRALKDHWYSINQEVRYKKLALEHADEIITNLNKRFVGGFR